MKFFALNFLIFSFLFVSCSDKDNNVENKIVCVLFDLSETTNYYETRKNYLDNFKIILNTMQGGDAIYTSLITERSVSDITMSLNFEFNNVTPKTDTELFLKIAKKQTDSLFRTIRDSIITSVNMVLLNPPKKINSTEILSSLQIAERVFKSYPQQRKILVVFSDMIEDSKQYNFENDILSDKNTLRIINNEKSANLIPDLANVKIYIVGAFHSNTNKYNRIKDFWLKYFKTTGASLQSHNYGASLIRFDE
jgi:hypothetical protein